MKQHNYNYLGNNSHWLENEMGGDSEACSAEVKKASTFCLPQAKLDCSSPIPPAPADWAARIQLHVAQRGVGSSG